MKAAGGSGRGRFGDTGERIPSLPIPSGSGTVRGRFGDSANPLYSERPRATRKRGVVSLTKPPNWEPPWRAVVDDAEGGKGGGRTGGILHPPELFGTNPFATPPFAKAGGGGRIFV
eukprot:gene13489-biopygen5031